MARYTGGMSLDEEGDFYDNRNLQEQQFKDSISTPEGMAAYNKSLEDRWYDISHHINGYEAESGFDQFMGHLTTGIVDNIPLIYGALLTAGAAGAFGGAAGATGAAGAGAAEAGLGGLAAEGAAAGVGAGGLAGLGGAAEAGLGLGAAIPNAGTVIISGAAGGGAAGGIGLGGLAAGAGAAAGLGSMIAPDGSPIQGPMQSVEVPRPAPETTGGLPAAGAGSAGGLLSAGDLGSIGIGALPYLDSVAQGNAPATGGVKPSLPGLGGGSAGNNGGLGGLLNGLGSLYGAYNDTKNNAADTEFYKNQLDQMTGMYKPGTPEATLMEQQMNAKDAAAGRNSQYGTRATNLAGALAQQRAQIMTSSAYQHTADMYRNKGAQNANPYLNLLGQGTQGGGGLGSIFGALGSGYNWLNGMSGGNIGNSISSGLGSLFGTSPPSMGSGAIDNILF